MKLCDDAIHCACSDILEKESKLVTCYECGTKVHEVSPRSRCCQCEYARSKANEQENDQLRERIEELEVY